MVDYHFPWAEMAYGKLIHREYGMYYKCKYEGRNKYKGTTKIIHIWFNGSDERAAWLRARDSEDPNDLKLVMCTVDKPYTKKMMKLHDQHTLIYKAMKRMPISINRTKAANDHARLKVLSQILKVKINQRSNVIETVLTRKQITTCESFLGPNGKFLAKIAHINATENNNGT